MTPPLELPKPTRDLAQVREDLDRYGLALVEDALDRDEVRALRARLVEQSAGERAAGIATIDAGGANQRVWNLVSKGRVFRELLTRPLTLSCMRHVLGPQLTLSSFTANIAGTGGEPMTLHSDQGYMPPATPYAVVANIMWMLDDFSEHNGATRVVPGSHRLPRPDPSRRHESVAATGRAGTALVFDGRLWHGTGANRSDAPRHGILSYFCRPFLRPQENATLSAHPAALADASPELLELLGFGVWQTLGGVQGPFGRVARDVPFVGELDAHGRERNP